MARARTKRRLMLLAVLIVGVLGGVAVGLILVNLLIKA